MPGNVYDFKLFESNQLIWDYAIITEPAIPEYINMADLSPGMLKITLYLENLLKYFQKMCLNIFFFDWLFLKFSANQRKIIKPREHSYMTSDVFWEFLTYLPTLIRYFTT